MNRPSRTALVGGSALLAVAVVTAAAIGFGGKRPVASSSATRALPAVAPVTRTTLTRSQQVNGVLGYGASVTVAGRGSGTLTWLPRLGATIKRGRSVYRADDDPVPLFYGRLPLYRQLRIGDAGRDVEEVERNLAALGYPGLTVDRRYTWATAVAVRKWQQDLGLTQTGVFDPASVVIAPNAIRVSSLTGPLGNPASGPILAYTGTTKMVSIALDVALQTLVRRGLPATVQLPDGTTIKGRIAKVGAVAASGQNEQRPATIDVTVAVTLRDQSKIRRLDQAPVIVSLVSDSVRDVLTVPVSALAVLAEGGYGLQVVSGSTSRYVPVRLGMFGDGRVEVSGDGIIEGTLVGVPE
ncbi:peptidoglycan-binding protein [Microtetraspora sp. AC03309]|uniref:peptidoglycan-binding domain-containing protein n=1 Tax=Microtetraspora sp. AC03309 TaxID=2779376 RepID=UPI001E44A873|nr:peptidoglycan-binding domain-containing protein [Microtetraspora sp. AC03309]MCC5580271.1 peptidoglycan-binding protein [Microtetraspora sp. AC03309]